VCNLFNQSVLAIFAHPDDESLVAGGAIKACSEKGLEIVIISLTRGEQGSIANSALATRETLGDVRKAELQAAANKLGVKNVECFNYPDGGLSWANTTEIENLLSERIRRWQPNIIITFGADGFYWHPDHIAVHELTKSALYSLRNEDFSPAVYYAAYPTGQMSELAQKLESRGLNFNAWGLKPSAFGVPAGDITTRLDVRAFLNAKLEALNCHRTQFSKDNTFVSLPPDLAEEFLGREYFIRDVSANGETDILAEIVG